MTREKSRPCFPVQPDQLAVQADRRGAGRQAQHGRPAGGVVLPDQAFDHQGDVRRGLGWWGRPGWGPWCWGRNASPSKLSEAGPAGRMAELLWGW